MSVVSQQTEFCHVTHAEEAQLLYDSPKVEIFQELYHDLAYLCPIDKRLIYE